MKKVGIIIGLSFSLFLVSCCWGCRSIGSKQITELLSSKWQVEELMGLSVDRVMEDSYSFQFDTKKGSAYGRGDCNRFFSSYAIEGKSEIKFSTIGSTKMVCKNQDTETLFFNALKSVNGFIIDSEELMLLNKGTVVAVLVKIIE